MVRAIFSNNFAYTFAKYNTLYGTTLQKLYSDNDMECAEVLSTGMYDVRHGNSSTDLMLRTIATA